MPLVDVLALILRKMIANCESIFLNEQFIIMSSYSFLLYTKLTSIHYVVLGYDFIRIKKLGGMDESFQYLAQR